MNDKTAALALHAMRTGLLAHHKHSALAKSLDKTGAAAVALFHGPDHQGLLAVLVIIGICAFIYGCWITFVRPGN